MVAFEKCVWCGFATLMLLLGILPGRSSVKGQEPESEVPTDRQVEFLTRGETFFFNIGDTVLLPCKIVQTSEDEFIKVWIKNKDILFAGSFRVHPDTRLTLGPDGGLKIEGLLPHDDAVYTCKVNSQIEPNSIQHRLILPGPPKLKTVPEGGEVKVMKGESFEIACVASGKPDSVITWRHMNDSSIDVNMLVKNNGIVVDSAESKHSGTYECTATNGYGDPAVAYITVKVLGKPTVKASLQWSQGVGGTLNAELLCVTHSDTNANTRWVRDDGTWLLHGESVSLYTAGNHYTAKFKHVTEQDYGNYTCESKNKYGITTDTVELSGVPTKPIVAALEAPNSTAYHISLSTVTPYPVIKYMVYIRAEKHMHDMDEWRNISIPKHFEQKMGSKYAITYVISNLEPGTTYEAYASVGNQDGMSRLTDFKFTTASDALQEEIKDDPNAGSSSSQPKALNMQVVGCLTVALLSIFFC